MKVKCPDLDTIIPGARFLYHAKIGGERQTINVIAKTPPYSKDFGKGRSALYVDCFGYGWSGSVQAKKLRSLR